MKKDKKDMFSFENKYTGQGCKSIAGIDEAGRGPLAGPVCCACVIMPLDEENIVQGIDDSKKLTEKKREQLFGEIISKAIAYEIVFVDEKVIDRINILQATKEGMLQALRQLKISPDMVFVDAVRLPVDNAVAIVHGDAVSYNIAAASILAKVSRDRYISGVSEKYPQYNFAKHKGYGTREHIEALKKYGKCDIHRDTFIRKFIS